MSPVARALRLLVRGYRTLVSPLLPPRCRFAPTCSQYALEALEVHGAARGGWLAVRRVARCHPFHPGGHDPVPPRAAARTSRHDPAAPRVSDDGEGPAASRARATSATGRHGPAARTSPSASPDDLPSALPLGARS